MIKHHISIINEQKDIPLTRQHRALLRKAVRLLLKQQSIEQPVEVAILFIDAKAMQEMNWQYRGQDKPTDVLSFATEDDPGFTLPEELAYRPLGDIIIAPTIAQVQAENMGHILDRELAFLVLHGLLHLLGFDHGDAEDDTDLQRMLALQDEVLSDLGL